MGICAPEEGFNFISRFKGLGYCSHSYTIRDICRSIEAASENTFRGFRGINELVAKRWASAWWSLGRIKVKFQ